MDPVQYEVYNVNNLNPKKFLDATFGTPLWNSSKEGAIKIPMQQLHHFFEFAEKKGTLIDITPGPVLLQLYSASNSYSEIFSLKYNDESITEMNKWLHDDPGALDWKKFSQYVSKLEGNSNKDAEKDKQLKGAIKYVVKCYTDKKNITDPFQLPPADCLLIGLTLDIISRNKDDYISNLKLYSTLLKPGGDLLIFGLLDATYFIIDGKKYHLLQYNKEFLINALEGEGYDIYHYDVQRRETESDLSDFKAFIFVAAQKKP